MDITYSKTPCTYKPWQRITSLITLILFFFQIPTVAFAQALANSDIQIFLENNYQFERASSSSSYQYQPALHLSDVEENYYSINDFYKRLLTSLPERLGAPKYIPIGVGDITTFIPVYKGSNYKEVGSPFVQSRYIREQVMELLGRTLIDPADPKFGDERSQIISLYNNAYLYAQSSSSAFGDVLSVSRVDAPFNMVWPEIRTIHGEQVLVPVLYLTSTLVGKRKVETHVTEFDGVLEDFDSITVQNAHIDFGRNAFLDVINDLTVENGSLASDGDMEIVAGGTLKLLSGQIDANGNLNVSAHGVDAQTLVHRYSLGGTTGTKYDIVTDISASGDMVIRSFRDVHIQGSSFNAGGSMTLAADGSIRIESVELTNEEQTYNGRWLTNNTSVDYLQSSLTAEQTLELIANSDIQIDGAELISNEGHIKLLAGMGITIENDFSSTHEVAKYRSSKKKKEVEAYKTVAIRSALDAGKGVTIHSEYGDINLRAVAINSSQGTAVTAQNGAVNLLMAKETDHYSYHSVSKRIFSTRTVNKGHNIETAVYPMIVGGFTADGLYGVNVDIEFAPELTREEQLDKLADMDGMQWIADIRDNDSVLWNEIKLVHDQWNDVDTTLSPAAMAMISIAVAVAMGPAGFGAMGTVNGAAQSLAVGLGAAKGGAIAASFGAAVAAGTTAIASNAALSLASGNSVTETLEKLAKEETLKSLAVSMVTAAAISGIDAKFFTPEQEQVLGAKAELSLGMQATQAVVHAGTSSAISTVVDGGSLSDFGDAFTMSLMQSAIDRIGQEMAEEIGEAYKKPDGISNAVRYMAHAATGCMIGVASGSLTNTETSSGNNCASGAGGAVVGELVADWHKEANGFEKQQALLQELEADLTNALNVKIDGVDVNLATLDPNNLTDAQKLALASFEPKISNYENQVQYFSEMKAKGVDLAKLGAGFAALAAGGNVELAAAAGENAAENNALFIIPLVKFALAAWTAIEIVEAVGKLQETLQELNDFDSLTPQKQEDLLYRIAEEVLTEVALDLLTRGSLKKIEDLIEVARENPKFDALLNELESAITDREAGVPYEPHKRQTDSHIVGNPTEKRIDLKDKSDQELLDMYNSHVSNGTLDKDDLARLRDNGHIFNPDTKRFSNPNRKFDKTAEVVDLPDIELDYTGLTRKVKIDDVEQDLTMDDLVSYRQQAQQARANLSADAPATEHNRLLADTIKYSEAIGELAKDAYVKKLDAKPLAYKTPGNGQQGQFDGIYTYFKDGEERLLILEAKGGVNPQLGGRKDKDGQYVQQGTKEYKESVIQNMKNVVENADSSANVDGLIDTLDAIEKFTDLKKIDYQLVQQKIDKASGVLSSNVVSNFN